MSLIFDTGAFIAYERSDVFMRALIASAAEKRTRIRTSTTIVAQVWRDGARQARLTRILRSVEEVAFTPSRARAVGALLRVAKTADIADAAIVELAEDGDEVLTSDQADIVRVANHSGKTLIITPV